MARRTNNEHYADMCDTFRNCGRLKGSAWYEHGALGANYRLSQFQAALLRTQLKRLDEQTDKRDRNGKYLDRELAAIEGIRPLVRSSADTRVAYHLYIFRYDQRTFKNLPKGKFVESLAAEGIPASVGYPVPLNQQPLFARKNFGSFTGYSRARAIDYAGQKLPVCERACRDEAIWLHQTLLLGEQEDMADIVKAIKKIRGNI